MKHLKLILILFLLSEINLFCFVINETHIYERSEIIDGMEFCYSKKATNNTKEVAWFINDKQVTREEYKETLLKYKQKEWEQQIEKEEENQLLEDDFKMEAQIIGTKKLLSLKIKEIEELFKKIKELKEYELTNYFDFNDNNFKSQYDLDNLEKSLMPEIRKYLEKSYDKITLFDLNNYLDKIDDSPNKLNMFFKNTICNAIKLCDDTKLLRKLLELVN